MKLRTGLIFFIIAGLLTGLLGYTFSGLRVLGALQELGYLQWCLSGTALLALAAVFYLMANRRIGRLFIIAAHFLLLLITGLLSFSVLLVLGDLSRVLTGLFHLLAGAGFALPGRSVWSILIALTGMLAVLGFMLDGMLRGKYAYRVIEHELYFDDLPDAFDGFSILQLSDIHAGSLKRASAVHKGVDLALAQQADVIVFTGDLVNNEAREALPWVNVFSRLRAPYGQFSILGNHDYGDYISWPDKTTKEQNLSHLKTIHDEMGFRLLLDEHVRLEKDGASLVLAGVENWGLGFGERGDLEKALSGLSEKDFKVLLSHDPSHWENQVKNNPQHIQLTLSGHTHGMQFGLEFMGFKWSPVQYRYRHWAGLKEENRRVLNINRGFGFIGFSGRVGIWPEITLLRLRKRPGK